MADLLRVYFDPAEIHPTTGYPYAWFQHRADGCPPIKDLIREIAGHRCERCGHPYEKGLGEWSSCDDQCTHAGPTKPGRLTHSFPLAQWRVLTVHHLNGVKHDCRWWNLVALCQRCHLTIQGKVYMERPWNKPHSKWFRPFVAGFYAWKYLDLELTREEAMSRLDELLDLELTQEALF